MSASLFLEVWTDTLVTTGLLIFAILLIRKPFARHFGPRLGYALWLIPALRLILPPLPFADPIIVSSASHAAMVGGTPESTIDPFWSLTDAMPYIFALWAMGAIAVLSVAIVAHLRFRRRVLDDAVMLQPIGSILLVMSDAVDGPVAFGLWRRIIAVPHDFFARYVVDERELAIDHELSHHRHGDIWANSAALVILATQWFNPFAWRAIRAFRFDQEAACDVRVLTKATDLSRSERAARYAVAIAKAAVGPRLSLAAPMASRDTLHERLAMLSREDVSRARGHVGRFILAGGALGVLSATATLVPSGIVVAQEVAVSTPAFLPEKPSNAIILSSNGVKMNRTVVSHMDGASVSDHRNAEGHSESWPASAGVDAHEAAPEEPSHHDVHLAVKQRSAAAAQARTDIAAREAEHQQRRQIATWSFPPAPPAAPAPPAPPQLRTVTHDVNVTVIGCGQGAATVMRTEDADGHESRVQQIKIANCVGLTEAKAAQLAALKKVRDQFTRREWSKMMADDVRKRAAADLDRAIADMEKSVS